MTAKELREKRAVLVPEMRKLADKSNDEKADWQAQDQERWEALNKDYDELTKQIDGNIAWSSPIWFH